MKASIKKVLLWLTLASCCGCFTVGKVSAQAFRVLHTFTPEPTWEYVYTNWDGGNPDGPLVFSSNVLYGTAYNGGTAGSGTVFKINTDGTGYAVLHEFTSNPTSVFSTNSDGAGSLGGLVILGNTLYGTTIGGGAYDFGTLYAVNMDGSGFTNLHNFSDGDGGGPVNGLVLSGSTFYGATWNGADNGGSVYAINTDGSSFTNLHSFVSSSEGDLPWGGLVLLSNTLYGVTSQGGPAGYGTVFAVNTDGTGFTNLHNFLGGSEGTYPLGPLTSSGNTLFGGTGGGGTFNYGTIFAINTDGTGFATIRTCSIATGYGAAGLMAANNLLYGIADEGGPTDQGLIFEMGTDGTGFTSLHGFSGGEGSYAKVPPILSGNTFYGVAFHNSIHDNSGGNGTIFSLSMAPQLTITPAGTNMVLSWPTNVAGFDYTGYTLQSSAGIDLSANWSAVSLPQAIAGGQCVVTNPVSSTQMFYRLSH